MSILLGSDTAFSSGNSVPEGYVHAWLFDGLADQGTIDHVAIYIESVTNAATSLKIGVYGDNSGVPDTLRSHSLLAHTITEDEYNGVQVSSSSVAQGYPYWIAVIADGQLGIRDEYNGGSVYARAGDGTLTVSSGLPSTWPGNASTGDHLVSAYASGVVGP